MLKANLNKADGIRLLLLSVQFGYQVTNFSVDISVLHVFIVKQQPHLYLEI